MPFSSGAGKEFIREHLRKIQPKRILDIGAGAGNMPKRYRTNGQHWTGVEVWEPYVEQYKLRDQYQVLVVQDARTVDYGEDLYDVAFAGDVLEHMTYADAQQLMAKLRRAARYVIVSIPMGNYPQGAYEGNPYEEHITNNWSPKEVEHQFGQIHDFKVTPPVGTFIFTRPESDTKLKFAVYAISKNEEQFVERFCNSAKDADYIVIADTGSTDKTVELAKKHGAIVHDICIKPWRFDLARNACLALVPADADICVGLDLDEVLVDGWRAEMERLWRSGKNTTRLRYGFDWGHGIKFAYEKTHARAGYLWHHPCHEYPIADPRTVEVIQTTDKTLVEHYPDPTKSRAQYMDLLEVSVKEDPYCPRNAFYYARELTYNGRPHEAIVALKKYLEMPKTWANERCYAMRLLGKCYGEINNSHESMQWYHRAVAEAPYTREPWFELAFASYLKKDWTTTYMAATKCLEIGRREAVYTCDPEAWGWKPHDLRAIGAYHLKIYDVAVLEGIAALAASPEDVRLKENLEFYKKAVNP